MSTIQLFSYPTSPFAQKVGCYLKYKQLEFKFVPVNPLTNAEIAFTRQRQVPVMQIDDEWRKESSELGIWLDDVYPDRPLLPTDQGQREQVLAVDDWVSQHVLTAIFRYAVQWQSSYYSITNGWRLARAVNNATRLPPYVRVLWPFGVKRAPFIVDMVNKMDLSESLPDMNARLQLEFVQQLASGEFLANQSQPTLADFSAFPAVVSGYMMGRLGR